MPCFFNSSGTIDLSSWSKATGGNVTMRIAASLPGSAKPVNALVDSMPAGGTRPTREPIGKRGSAALAGMAQTTSAKTKAQARNVVMVLELIIASRDCQSWLPVVPGLPSAWVRHPPQREIDPPAFGEQGRRTRIDTVDAMKRQPGGATKRQRIAGIKAERARRVAAPVAAGAE